MSLGMFLNPRGWHVWFWTNDGQRGIGQVQARSRAEAKRRMRTQWADTGLVFTRIDVRRVRHKAKRRGGAGRRPR